jgi:hypothetical protein
MPVNKRNIQVAHRRGLQQIEGLPRNKLRHAITWPSPWLLLQSPATHKLGTSVHLSLVAGIEPKPRAPLRDFIKPQVVRNALPASLSCKKTPRKGPRLDFLGGITGPWPVQRDFRSGRPTTSRQSSYPDVPGFHPPAIHSSCAADRWLTQPARRMPARTMIEIPVFIGPYCRK